MVVAVRQNIENLNYMLASNRIDQESVELKLKLLQLEHLTLIKSKGIDRRVDLEKQKRMERGTDG